MLHYGDVGDDHLLWGRSRWMIVKVVGYRRWGLLIIKRREIIILRKTGSVVLAVEQKTCSVFVIFAVVGL